MWALQQPFRRVVLKDLDLPDIAAQRVRALVSADFDELEDRGTPGGGAGEEPGPKAMAREVGWVVASFLGVELHDLGDALGSERVR